MLYTEEQQRARDRSPWTMVQAVLAPFQFIVMLISVVLVARYLMSGDGYVPATASIIAKTLILYTIMVTGAIWEKDVFGQYLFAKAFFWEDVVSMAVIALHTAYLAGLMAGWPPQTLMVLALAAYAVYTINAVQFLCKLRQARLERRGATPPLAEATS